MRRESHREMTNWLCKGLAVKGNNKLLQTYLKSKPAEPFQPEPFSIHTDLLVRARPCQVPRAQINGSIRARRLLGTQAAEGRRGDDRVGGGGGRQDSRGAHGLRSGVLGRRRREQGQGPLGRKAQQAGKAGHGLWWWGVA